MAKTRAGVGQRIFIGQTYDPTDGLSYLNARYYNGSYGRFVSEDLLFINVYFNLADPQSLNSYSYSRDNPIVLEDPSGQASIVVINAPTQRTQINVIQASPGGTVKVVSLPTPNVTISVISSPYSTNNQKTTTWDPVTDNNISQLDPRVQQPATNFINNTQSQLGIDLRVDQGYRSIQKQNSLYAQGRSTPGNIVTDAKGGQSYHNYGLAIDVVVMEKGKPNFSKPIGSDIAGIAKAQGFEWGGDWVGFKDYPHFRLRL